MNRVRERSKLTQSAVQMARAKKNKRLKQRRENFYEAMPMSFTPPAALPEVSEQLVAGAEAISDKWQSAVETTMRGYRSGYQKLSSASPWKPRVQAFIDRIVPVVAQTSRQTLQWTRDHVLASGLATADTVLRSLRTGALALRFSTDAALNYTPPIAADLQSYARRLRRAATSRRARAIYLSLAAGGSIMLVSVAAISAASVMTIYASDISSPSALLSKKKTGTTIVDRNGSVLFEGYGAQANKEVPLSSVPMNLRNATLAAEDPDFYQHPGFSWRGTARAAFVDITHRGTVEGGSTLTQQLVKNALLTSDKDFSRKFRELLLSMELEKRYSKDQILEMYLNEIYYGEGSSGVEAASQTYFHKSVSDLTLSESALIAGLPLGPSRFDPNGNTASATGRRNFVLTRMQELGKITKAQADAAKTQPIKLASTGAPEVTADNPMVVYARSVNIRAPHFVFYVLDQLRKEYGDDLVEQGGITVTTTLDLSKQNLAQDSVNQRVSALASHNVSNGALISMDPSKGDIIAMVGSLDYNAPGFGNVNVILSDRQPGSSFKPITYATAFKKGWNGATHVDDAPMSLPNGDGTTYVPQNYDLKFRGSVSLREALANSLNIPALKVQQFASIHDTIQTAHDMGVTGLKDESRYGLALALGGGEVRPIDMATVYATFANNGTKVMPRSILKVSNRMGKDITKSTKPVKTERVIDPRIAYMLTSILSDNSARTPEFGANSPLKLSRPAAAKTGTTNDFRDNWTVGYTPQLVTAVWVGNNDNTAMSNVDGITGAAPIWHDFMEGALADLPVIDFTVPSGITMAKVCSNDGGLANAWDSGYDEAFMADAMPTKHCSSYSPSRPLESPSPQNSNSGQSSSGENTPAPETPSPTPGETTKPTPSGTPIKTPKPGSI